MKIIGMIILMIYVHYWILVLLLLCIVAQVMGWPRDFDGAWERGLIYVCREVRGGAAPSMEVMGFPFLDSLFPPSSFVRITHTGLRGGSETFEDQLLVGSTDAMNGSVRVPPWQALPSGSELTVSHAW